ncbi:hypothetical protein BJ742DRAFT_794735 [Cladochytrium replicatum]|nr:hypothetical protein BJ742DRAFT_794735 [Cladochytrium replicatum]
MKLPQNTSTISAPATGSTAQSLKVTPSPAKPSPLTDFNTVPVPVPGPIKLGTWGDDTKKALSLIYHQPSYYAIVEIKQRPYHVHLNDVVITMRMNDCKLGDVLQLDRVREIGSMEYILQGNPYLHPDYIDIKAVVIEHPAAKEVVRQHWKKRGHDKIVRNRSHHTALRISEINIKKPPPT